MNREDFLCQSRADRCSSSKKWENLFVNIFIKSTETFHNEISICCAVILNILSCFLFINRTCLSRQFLKAGVWVSVRLTNISVQCGFDQSLLIISYFVASRNYCSFPDSSCVATTRAIVL